MSYSGDYAKFITSNRGRNHRMGGDNGYSCDITHNGYKQAAQVNTETKSDSNDDQRVWPADRGVAGQAKPSGANTHCSGLCQTGISWHHDLATFKAVRAGAR